MRTILPVAGPLANDLDALEILVKGVIGTRPALLDPSTIDVPWRDIQSSANRKLRLGLLSADPLYPLHPPVQHALELAVRALKESGHEIISLGAELGHVADAAEVAWKLWGLDDRANSIVKASGEPAVPSRLRIADEAKNMDWNFVPDLSGMDGLGKLSALNVKRAEIVADWNRVWAAENLDAVIAPSAGHTAVEHDRFGIPAYTSLLNILEVRQYKSFVSLQVLTHRAPYSIRPVCFPLGMPIPITRQLQTSKSSQDKEDRHVGYNRIVLSYLYANPRKTILTLLKASLVLYKYLPAECATRSVLLSPG